MKRPGVVSICLFLTTLLTLILPGCQTQPSPTTTPILYSEPQLRYRLIGNFGDVFFCDPDFWPIVRPGEEEKKAIEQYPAIKANSDEFSAILNYLGMEQKDNYTTEEKVLIYRQHKKINGAIELTASGSLYNYVLRVGEGEGLRIEGTITRTGQIAVTKQETSFNTCPICLAKGTLIDTPEGQVPVEELKEGMVVWTLDDSGKRVSALLIKVSATPVPTSFKVVRASLEDGRAVMASAGHPASNGRPLGDFQVGDILDGAKIVQLEYLDYYGKTCDILPAGTTGLYWANGILLKSTLIAR